MLDLLHNVIDREEHEKCLFKFLPLNGNMGNSLVIACTPTMR